MYTLHNKHHWKIIPPDTRPLSSCSCGYYVHRDLVFSILACNQNLNARKHLNWGNYFDLSYHLMENCMCALEIALSYAVMALSVRWILCKRGKIILMRSPYYYYIYVDVGRSEFLCRFGYLCILLYTNRSFSQFNGASLLCYMSWFSRVWRVWEFYKWLTPLNLTLTIN